MTGKLLRRQGLSPDPFKQFVLWFGEARRRAGQHHPDAMCLSTIGLDGCPDARIVLLKGVDERGFVFYTNLRSTKGRELAAKPKAALTFYWDKMARQVRVRGSVELVGDAEADDYFASRPRMSQLAAWASDQSRTLSSRTVLVGRMAKLVWKFKGKPVPRPPHWHGLRLVPKQIEFWRGRLHRLHDRFLYIRKGKRRWIIRRLYP